MNKMLVSALTVLAGVGMALEAAPTLVSRWDFDRYNPADVTESLKPTVGSNNIEVRCGNNSSGGILSGIIGPAYIVDGSTAPGLPAGDYAIALPKDTHLKVPFPSGVIKDKHWTLRVRFFHPTASGARARSILQPRLDNKGQYFLGLSNANYLWIDHTQAPGNQYTGADGAENGFSNGNIPSRTAAVEQWHTLTVCVGSNGLATYLDGIRNTSMTGSYDPRAMFTGDGLLLFADNSNEDALVYVSSVELWQDTPVYHNNGYIQTSAANLFTGASLNDVRDGLSTVRGLGTWMAYSTPMHSFERIVTDDGNGNATSLKLDFANWGSDQNILAQFDQNGEDVTGYSLRMAWNLGWNNRFFTDDGGFAAGQQSRAAGTYWNYGGYAPYNLYCTPFVTLKDSIRWTKVMGVGQFGSPRVTVCTGSPTLTFDQAPQVQSLTFESGFGNGPVNLAFAFSNEAYKTMDAIGALNLDKDVTLTIPTGVSVGGTFNLQKGAALVVTGYQATSSCTLFAAAGGVVLPAGTAIEEFVRCDTGRVTLSDDGKQILYTPLAANAVATAAWTGNGDAADPADPQNWSCWGVDGALIADAIPTADTTVLVSGETSLNVPANAGFVCRRLAFSGEVTLTQSCDWSGLGGSPALGSAMVTIPEGMTLSTLHVNDFCGNCSFKGDGRFKATDDNAFGGNFPPAVLACSEVEMAGDVDFANCSWVGANQLILSGNSTLRGEGSTSEVMPGAIVIPENAVVTVPEKFNAAACLGWNFRAKILVDGGLLTGQGHLYFSAWGNQEVDLDLNSGRVEVALRPWTSYYQPGCKVVQTGGVFAPNSLQPFHDNANPYRGTLASYTFKGGVFEPPAGWELGYPWLPVTVPEDGEATIRVVRTATVAAPVTVAGKLTVESAESANELTLGGLAGDGTLAVSGSPRLQLAAGASALKLTSAETTTLTLGSAGTTVFSAALTNETYLGNLALAGGTTQLAWGGSIGGALTFETGAKLRFDTGAEQLATFTPLFTAEGGITLPEGAAITDFVEVSSGTALLSEDGRQILLVPDATVPITAVWTGAGDRANPADTANWACTNVLGEGIVAIPTADTTIFLSGETSLNIPTNCMPSCRELRITGPISLSADCDWRGLDSLTRLVDGTIIDLQGKSLTLACPNGESPTTITVTNSTTTVGTLTLEVPADAQFTNSRIALQGNLKLEKSGAGTLVPQRASQTYSGGTDIVAGMVKATTPGTDAPLGMMWGSNLVTVREGATFDIAASYHFTVYTFVLDGGCFMSSATSNNGCRFGSSRLTADSTWRVAKQLQFWSSHTLDLGGHRLAVDITPDGTNMILGENGSSAKITIKNGTFDVVNGGWFKIISPVDAATADIRMGAAISVNSSFDVHDYDAVYDAPFCMGTGKMRVFGRFTPHHGGFYGCELQSGATLDVSKLEEVWSTTRTITGGSVSGNGTVTFADGAVVTVDIGNRQAGTNQKVVTWNETPTNFETLSFKAPARTNYRVYAKEDGVYVSCGFVILVR